MWEVVGRGMVVERTGDLEARLQALKLKSNLVSESHKAKEQEKGVEEKERLKGVVGIMGGRGRLGILAGVIARSSGGESGLTVHLHTLISLWPGLLTIMIRVSYRFLRILYVVCVRRNGFSLGKRQDVSLLSPSPRCLDGSRS